MVTEDYQVVKEIHVNHTVVIVLNSGQHKQTNEKCNVSQLKLYNLNSGHAQTEQLIGVKI